MFPHWSLLTTLHTEAKMNVWMKKYNHMSPWWNSPMVFHQSWSEWSYLNWLLPTSVSSLLAFSFIPFPSHWLSTCLINSLSSSNLHICTTIFSIWKSHPHISKYLAFSFHTFELDIIYLQRIFLQAFQINTITTMPF